MTVNCMALVLWCFLRFALCLLAWVGRCWGTGGIRNSFLYAWTWRINTILFNVLRDAYKLLHVRDVLSSWNIAYLAGPDETYMIKMRCCTRQEKMLFCYVCTP